MTDRYELREQLEKKELEAKLSFTAKHPEYIHDLEQRKFEEHESRLQHNKDFSLHFKEFSEHMKKFDEHLAVVQAQNQTFVDAVTRIADVMEKSNSKI